MLLNALYEDVSFVFDDSSTVGFGEVLQTIPYAEIDAPPLEITFPPEQAVFDEIDDIALVWTAGNSISVVKYNSSPYEVQLALVA